MRDDRYVLEAEMNRQNPLSREVEVYQLTVPLTAPPDGSSLPRRGMVKAALAERDPLLTEAPIYDWNEGTVMLRLRTSELRTIYDLIGSELGLY